MAKIETTVPVEKMGTLIHGYKPQEPEAVAAPSAHGVSVNAADLNIPGAGEGIALQNDEYIPSFPDDAEFQLPEDDIVDDEVAVAIVENEVDEDRGDEDDTVHDNTVHDNIVNDNIGNIVIDNAADHSIPEENREAEADENASRGNAINDDIVSDTAAANALADANLVNPLSSV